MATTRKLVNFSLSSKPHENTYGEKLGMQALIFGQYDVCIENNQYVDDCNANIMF
jgi:hypothetical protein